MSVRESVPVEIFDYLLHSAGLATASLELRDCSCLRFKYLQNALINSAVESWVKKVEDTILHNMTVWCQFNCSFSCRKFFEIWSSSRHNERVMSHVSCVVECLRTFKKLPKLYFYLDFIPERLLSSPDWLTDWLAEWLGWWSLLRVLAPLSSPLVTVQEMQGTAQFMCAAVPLQSSVSAPPPPPDFLHWILSLYFLIFLSLRPVSMPVNWTEQFSSIKAELLWRCWNFRQISAVAGSEIYWFW